MGNLYLEAFKFYKQEHANSLVLFHIASSYEAYENDAVQLSELTSNPCLEGDGLKVCRFPENLLSDVMANLTSRSVPVYIVEYCDESGNFAIPNVKQIIADMEADY